MSDFYDDDRVAGEVTRLLRVDPLDLAEKISGETYATSDDVGFLGLALAARHNKIKDDVLVAADDTLLSNQLATYCRILTEEGFQLVLSVSFTGTGWGDEPVVEESLQLWWHSRDALLLCFDTFGGDRLNAAKIYYNWRPTSEGWLSFMSSGSLHDGVWVGDHDAREALRLNLRNLRAKGIFVNPWVKQPFLHLSHYMEHRMPDEWPGRMKRMKATNAARIAALPEEVQTAIRGTALMQNRRPGK